MVCFWWERILTQKEFKQLRSKEFWISCNYMERKVKTPCVGVCSTVFGDQVCRGCKRFQHEVIEWNGYSDFEKETVYWVAVDKFIRAKSIDKTLTEKANKAIATYSKYFPNTESCFFNGVESGQRYKVECWINESTKVRTRD